MGKGNLTKGCDSQPNMMLSDAISSGDKRPSSSEALLETLTLATGAQPEELLSKPLIGGEAPAAKAINTWIEDQIAPNERYKKRYFPAINALNIIYPDWHKESSSLKKGLEMIDILFQDGANKAGYQRIDGGAAVWGADSAVAAWGYYSLPLLGQRTEPNKQVSWAGSARLDTSLLGEAIRNALLAPGPTFRESLSSRPSVTLSQGSTVPDGAVIPGASSGTVLKELLSEAGTESDDLEVLVRIQNADRLSRVASLSDSDRLALLRDSARLPHWGEPVEGDLASKVRVGHSKEGVPVAEPVGRDAHSAMLCDVWLSWVCSEQADAIAEAQRNREHRTDNWAWIDRTHQTASRSRWHSSAGKGLFGVYARGKIETRYRMIATLGAGTHRDDMRKKPANPADLQIAK